MYTIRTLRQAEKNIKALKTHPKGLRLARSLEFIGKTVS